LLRSLQEIQPDFVEEAKAYAGLWSQGKQKAGKYLIDRADWLTVLFIIQQ
jgi:hypothetical protein